MLLQGGRKKKTLCLVLICFISFAILQYCHCDISALSGMSRSVRAETGKAPGRTGAGPPRQMQAGFGGDTGSPPCRGRRKFRAGHGRNSMRLWIKLAAV